MIKYIYFEVYWQEGEQPSEPIIRNENILLLKPHTNSSGEWGFRNVTKGRYYYATVDQFWIDLEKYKAQKVKWDDPVFSKHDRWVQETLTKITNRQNESKNNL